MQNIVVIDGENRNFCILGNLFWKFSGKERKQGKEEKQRNEKNFFCADGKISSIKKHFILIFSTTFILSENSLYC